MQHLVNLLGLGAESHAPDHAAIEAILAKHTETFDGRRPDRRPVKFGDLFNFSDMGCPPEYAAWLCGEALKKLHPDGDEWQFAFDFSAYVELFSSAYWRDHAREGTFEIVGWADNQSGTDDDDDFLTSGIWTDVAMAGPSYTLRLAHYPGGFYAMPTISDEGFFGGLVIRFTQRSEGN